MDPRRGRRRPHGGPAHSPDDLSDDMDEYLFHDHDILLLFNQLMPGVEDPDDPMHDVVPDIADYRPGAWCDPFWAIRCHHLRESGADHGPGSHTLTCLCEAARRGFAWSGEPGCHRVVSGRV